MGIPRHVEDSGLYAVLKQDAELLTPLLALRAVTEKLAETISRFLPAFTDHSIRHMDALWAVTDRVLTSQEISAMSTAEAFLLATGFYLHDIGMAYAATDDGLARIRSSSSYKSLISRFSNSTADAPHEARILAIVVRQMHAHAAIELASKPILGTDIFLFESKSVRESWAVTCGRIASSHHWTLDAIEREYGSAGTVPLPGSRKGDLGYVAAVLRLVDYAHINRDRASTIERAFRQSIEHDSLLHWLAQEQIDGPERDGNELVYRAAVPIGDVDAWWLYYGMLVGLDTEIRAVRRYLDRRAASHGRLSLQTVRGANSPEEAAVYIPTSGFLPIEINLRTGSIARLVELLAGKSLYGPNPMAALRELIQNARDAVMLKAATANTDLDKAALSIPIKVILREDAGRHVLEVKDWGVGMTRSVMTDYLISIASDYWASQFHIDFPSAAARGFRPAGKFGIGFLSVFMLGDHVMVESNRDGGERCQLNLHGVGRRGEIRSVPSPSGSGTIVRIHLKESVQESLQPLPELVRTYAPTLPVSVDVEVGGEVTALPVGWLFKLSTEDFLLWTLNALSTLTRTRDVREWSYPRYRYHFSPKDSQKESEEIWSQHRPEYSNGKVRLVACFESTSLLCLKGLALQPISTPGFVGVIDLESAIPDVSRQRAIAADIKALMEHVNRETRSQIVAHLDSLSGRGLLIEKLGFLDECVSVYGRDVIRESSVPWLSFLKIPGEVELISSRQLLTRLLHSRSLFVAYDAGPWTAMRKWVSLDPAPEGREPAIVLDATSRSYGPHYISGDEKTASLAELWPHWQRASLFATILGLIAEAWQVNLEELAFQTGWRQSGTTVWGRFMRP